MAAARRRMGPHTHAGPPMGEEKKDEGGGFWNKVMGLPHAATEFLEGSHATKEVVEGAEAVKHSFAGTGIGLTPALESAAEGAPSFMQTVRQAQFAAQGSGGLTMASKALAPLALASGVMDMWGSGKDMKEKGANLENTPEMVKGGLEATAGGIGTMGLLGSALSALGFAGAGSAVGGAAAAAAPVGMVAGAGAAGMAAGAGMAEAADSKYTKTGLWGKDEGGNNKSAMDWGAGWGTWVDSHVGDKNPANPSVLGGIAAGAGGIVGGIAGTAQAGWNGLKSLF